ncbi:MAG: ATP-binding protein [Elusimicrobia bacterium]|nr:ATP-binding protein [Elusimicrobiota bacterium]
MYERRLAPFVRTALKDTPVVVLTGARQTGKSWLAQRVAQSSRYVTLDDAPALAAARHDPQGFVDGFKGPAVIDEVQRAPELFLPLKASVDRDRRPGRFLLTGSADVMFLPRLSDALVGRMEPHRLWPLSQGEIDGTQEGFVDALFSPRPVWPEPPPCPPAELWRRVLRGGFPEAVARTDPARRTAWFGSYLSALMDRDVRQLADIAGLAQLPPLLGLLAVRTTGLTNIAELGRAAGMPQTTLARYLSLLGAACLLHRLPPWSGNPAKRLVRTPKLILNDTGLAAHLAGADARRLESDPALRGALLENFVAVELMKQAAWSRNRPNLLHFRTHAGREVDLVLEDAGGRCVGVEVKAGTVTLSDFKGLEEFRSTLGKRFLRGVVLYGGREVLPFGKDLWALPVSALWGSVVPP